MDLESPSAILSMDKSQTEITSIPRLSVNILARGNTGLLDISLANQPAVSQVGDWSTRRKRIFLNHYSCTRRLTLTPNRIDRLLKVFSSVIYTANHIYSNYLLQILNQALRRVDRPWLDWPRIGFMVCWRVFRVTQHSRLHASLFFGVGSYIYHSGTEHQICVCRLKTS